MHYNISTVGLCATKATVWVCSHAAFYFDQLGRVIIVAKNEAIAKAIATDPYLKERKSPTAVDQQLYLK